MVGMKRVGACALAVVLGLSLVACSDDGDDTADDGADTAAEDTGTDSGSDTDGDEVDLGEFSGECAEFAAAFANAGAAIGTAFSGSPGEGLEEAAAYFEEVADQLPDEISDDFRIFAAAYSDFATALADADIDFSDPSAVDPEALAQLEELTQAFDSAEVQEATDNIEAYMEETCPTG